MDPKAETVDRDDDARDAVAAAREAAAAGPLAQRVSELETVLAVERAESARRLKEMDALMRQTRSALHDLQGDYRRTVAERDDLQEQLAVRDGDVRDLKKRVRALRDKAERAMTQSEGSAADVVATAIARAQRSEADLARARQTIASLREHVRKIEDGASGERVASLERQLALREQELIRAAERLAEVDALRVAEDAGDGERGASATGRVPGEADATDDARPSFAAASSTYIPVDADVAPSATDVSVEESGTYLPVVGDGATHTDAAASPSSPAESAPGPVPRVAVSRTRSPRKKPPAALPVLGGLTVEREVARDADGVLLHARDGATDRSVVVRVLPRGTVRPSQSSVERLLAVRHHNIAAVLRCDLGPDGPYVVCERPAGERLDAWVRRVGRVPERIALAVVLQVARALREGAAHGVHHGDLSPGSLWTDAAGVVRVAGLGLRELLPHREIRAPASFVAPERRRGQAPDARSDMYALGACLRGLVAGGTGGGEPPSLGSLRPPVRAGVIALADALSAPDREARPASWDDVVERVDDVLRDCDRDDEDGEDEGLVGLLVHRPHVLAGVIAVAVMLVAAWMHLMPGQENDVRKAFNDAIVRAEQLEQQGNVEGARRIYLEFVEGTGDADIELDAARRLDALRD